MRAAAAAAETEREAAGGENEVPAQILEVHLHLVNTAGLVSVLLYHCRANIPGSSGVTFVRLELIQLLQRGSGYELFWYGLEVLPEPLEDVFGPRHSHLLAGQVLRAEEWGGKREE